MYSHNLISWEIRRKLSLFQFCCYDISSEKEIKEVKAETDSFVPTVKGRGSKSKAPFLLVLG